MRCSIFPILLLVCMGSQARPPDALDDWPAGEAASPPIWLQLSGPSAHDAGALIKDWLPGTAGRRPYPSEGLALGLIAPIPDAAGRLGWTVLQPALPMAVRRAWPAQTHRRRLLLQGGISAWQDERRTGALPAVPWQPGHPLLLQLQLPLPPGIARSDWLQATLTLPLSRLPARAPVAQLAQLPSQPACQRDADCLDTRLSPQEPLQPVPVTVTDEGLVLDLVGWLAARSASAAAPAVISLQLTLEASQPDQVGQLQDIALAPPQWQPAWHVDAAELTGEAMLRHTLDSLLLMPQVMLPPLPAPVAVDALAALPSIWPVAEVPSVPAGCGSRTLMPESARLTRALLDRWRDIALAPAAREGGRHRLTRDGLPPRDLVTWLSPRPGRWQWPGNLLACREGTACDLMADMQGQLASLSDTLPWLSDAGIKNGQALQAGIPMALPEAGGELTELPLLPGETQGHLLWQRSDGILLLLADDTLRPRWAWLPESLRAHRQAWEADAGSEQPAWPEAPWQIASWQDAAGRWHRQAFGLLRGQVWRLDLDDVSQPVLGWRPDVADPAVGSLTLLQVRPQDSGLARPVLLLGARDAGAPFSLVLRDGLSGEPIWRAGPVAMPGVHAVDAAMTAGWTSPWSGLTAADKTFHYGLDAGNQLWRLTLDAHPPALYLMVTGLRRVATLADPPRSSRPADLAPGLAWLRHPASGARVPGVLMLSREAGGGETLLLVLDAAGDTTDRSRLARWTAGQSAPPDTVIGWQRGWAQPGERATGTPRWLRNQIHVATTTPTTVTGCAPAPRQSRLYRLPWRRGAAGNVSGATASPDSDTVLEKDAAGPVSDEPVLDAAGQVRWSATGNTVMTDGQAAKGSRRRISRETLPP